MRALMNVQSRQREPPFETEIHRLIDLVGAHAELAVNLAGLGIGVGIDSQPGANAEPQIRQSDALH